MSKVLAGKKVAILVTDGFEQVEMTEPKRALEEAGATVHIVSPKDDQVKGWQHTKWGDEFPVDVHLDQANPADYDALQLPGGVINPDKLRITEGAIEFITHFVENDKPIAAICHGPWTLINANAVKGLTVTSWPSLKVDLMNAGAKWVDEQVVRDKKLVTSRKPDDLPAFNQVMIELFAQQ